MKKLSLNKKGFTLIELLVVISIVSLLSSIILASIQDARAKGRDAVKIRSMIETRTALQMYFADKGEYPGIATINSNSYLSTNSNYWKTQPWGLVTSNYIKYIHPEIRFYSLQPNGNPCVNPQLPGIICSTARIYVKLEKRNSVLNSDSDIDNDSTATTYIPDGLSTNEGCTPQSDISDDQDLCFDLKLTAN